MSRFSRLKDPNQVDLIPEHERRVLLCQAFLKASDISNPVRLATSRTMHDLTHFPQLRPSNLSEHWSDVLHEEWTSLAGLEIYLDQPVSMLGAFASLDHAAQLADRLLYHVGHPLVFLRL